MPTYGHKAFHQKRFAESIAWPELRGRALSAYLELQVRVRQIPIPATHAQELFLLIEQHCKYWTYASLSERVEIVIFSEEMPTEKDLDDFLRSATAPNDEASISVRLPFLFGDLQQGG